MYNFLLDQLIYSGSDTMEFSDKQHSLPLLLLFLHLLFFISIAHDDDDLPKRVAASNNKVSALLVFGDSTVDPGNNNNLTTAFKSNFRPYGREFADHMPTGRFSDGRLTTDFVASYLGVKENLPPYLDSTLSIEEMMTGVSFASAGSGFDPLTPRLSNVIPMSKQLQYFREYKKRIESATGKQGTENHIKNAIFIISAGTNDFVVNYYSVPIRRRSYTVTGYHQFLLQQVKDFLQSLLDEGARNIAVVGLPPMGCLPVVISLFSNSSILQRGCVEQYSSVARDYNQMLQNELNLMQLSLANPGARLYYMDVYGPLIDMIQDPAKFGFDKVNVGCCGTGDLETSFLCNPASYVCSDASKYVFWDSIHPTEEAYHNLYKGTRSTVELIVNTSVSITHSPKTGISSTQSSAAALLLSFYFSLYFFLLYTALLFST